MNTWKGEVLVPSIQQPDGSYGPDVEDSWTGTGQWARDETLMDPDDATDIPAVMMVYAEADQAWFTQWGDDCIWKEPITYFDSLAPEVAGPLRQSTLIMPDEAKEAVAARLVSDGLTEQQRIDLLALLIGANRQLVAQLINNFIRDLKGYPSL